LRLFISGVLARLISFLTAGALYFGGLKYLDKIQPETVGEEGIRKNSSGRFSIRMPQEILTFLFPFGFRNVLKSLKQKSTYC
jgi:hypothetical protein